MTMTINQQILQKHDEAKTYIQSKIPVVPKTAVVLGSGLGEFVDQLEKGDILIKVIRTDGKNFFMVVQITDSFANYDNGYMTKRKYNAAPYTMSLPSEVQSIIDNYLLEMENE